MPEVNIEIGGRTFQVACQTGEEHFLQSAAKLLDNEASVLAEQIGRMPETRMLLMAGLMLADKTAGLEEDLRAAEARVEAQTKELANLKSLPPEQVEVAVIPPQVSDSMAEIAARAEALADSLEAKAG
ncbi:MAG: cell division protein ZapA [Pseudomonadota bacterium]